MPYCEKVVDVAVKQYELVTKRIGHDYLDLTLADRLHTLGLYYVDLGKTKEAIEPLQRARRIQAENLADWRQRHKGSKTEHDPVVEVLVHPGPYYAAILTKLASAFAQIKES